jgi:hypothetical protein
VPDPCLAIFCIPNMHPSLSFGICKMKLGNDAGITKVVATNAAVVRAPPVVLPRLCAILMMIDDHGDYHGQESS